MSDKTHYLGIDLHKKTSYWTLMNQEREIVYRKNLPTSKEGVERGIHEMGVEPVVVEAAIEPVSQWGWYGDLLEQAGFTVHLVDAYKTKLIASSKLKNDRVDAKILAELMRSNFLATAYRAPQETRDLREFMRHRAFLVRMRSSVRGRMHQILWKHGIQCPYSDLLGKKSTEWFETLSLTSPYDTERGDLLALWRTFSGHVTKYDDQCRFRASQSPDAGILMSIPGVGVITALTMLAEIGDYTRFHSPEKLASFAGLVASSHSSGEATRFGHITHRGSVWLRTAMVEATTTVNPKWGYLYDFYRRISEKKGSKVARVALARKVLILSWHLMKSRKSFDPKVGYSLSVKR